MRPIKLVIFAAVSTLAACTAVTPHENSDTVSLVKSEHVAECTQLTTMNASVTYQVGIFTRSEEAVKEDLIALGKNRALELGGDSIVAKGPVNDGKMSFDIYNCSK